MEYPGELHKKGEQSQWSPRSRGEQQMIALYTPIVIHPRPIDLAVPEVGRLEIRNEHRAKPMNSYLEALPKRPQNNPSTPSPRPTTSVEAP